MSEPVTHAEIEDVLSSIRRLVSENSRSTGSTGRTEQAPSVENATTAKAVVNGHVNGHAPHLSGPQLTETPVYEEHVAAPQTARAGASTGHTAGHTAGKPERLVLTPALRVEEARARLTGRTPKLQGTKASPEEMVSQTPCAKDASAETAADALVAEASVRDQHETSEDVQEKGQAPVALFPVAPAEPETAVAETPDEETPQASPETDVTAQELRVEQALAADLTQEDLTQEDLTQEDQADTEALAEVSAQVEPAAETFAETLAVSSAVSPAASQGQDETGEADELATPTDDEAPWRDPEAKLFDAVQPEEGAAVAASSASDRVAAVVRTIAELESAHHSGKPSVTSEHWAEAANEDDTDDLPTARAKAALERGKSEQVLKSKPAQPAEPRRGVQAGAAAALSSGPTGAPAKTAQKPAPQAATQPLAQAPAQPLAQPPVQAPVQATSEPAAAAPAPEAPAPASAPEMAQAAAEAPTVADAPIAAAESAGPLNGTSLHHILAEEARKQIADEVAQTALRTALSEEFLDEASLRDLVSDIVRQELQGRLGERITRNVRKLVRREIQRALASQELF